MSDKGIIADRKFCSGCKQVKQISMSIYTATGGEYHYCSECQTAGVDREPVSFREDDELQLLKHPIVEG